MVQTVPSRRLIAGAILALIPVRAFAQFTLPKDAGGLLNQLQKGRTTGAAGLSGASLSQGEIGSGLKDALKVAARNVIGRVGKPDGFNGDPASAFPCRACCNRSSSRCRPWAPDR